MIAPGTISVTIANGQSLSAAIDLSGAALVGIVMPSAWTAAGLTFQVSHDDGTTFNNLYDASGTEISLTVSTSRFVRLAPADWLGFNKIKVRSGTSGAAVAQGADRVIQLVAREV